MKLLTISTINKGNKKSIRYNLLFTLEHLLFLSIFYFLLLFMFFYFFIYLNNFCYNANINRAFFTFNKKTLLLKNLINILQNVKKF